MAEQQQQNPQAALAEVIAKALVAAGLVAESRVAEVQARIASGKATAEDWNLWVELSGEDSTGADRA